MRETVKERIDYIKKGETPPDTNQNKRKFSRAFLFINLIVFFILLTLIIQKKETTDYYQQTVAVNDVIVRVSIMHTINQPILATVTFTSEKLSRLNVQKNPVTITIAHEKNTIVTMPVSHTQPVLSISPEKPVTFTTSIPVESIREYAKKHDLLKPKRYVYHTVIPLRATFTLHTTMDYSVTIDFKCKVTEK